MADATTAKGTKSGKHQRDVPTDMAIRAKSVPGLYADGGSLYLKVEGTGAKRWVQRIVIKGRGRTDLGLGGYPDVSLAQARDKAKANRTHIKNGGDPIADKAAAEVAAEKAKADVEAAANKLTFAQAVDAYLSQKIDGFRSEKHRKQWRATLDNYAKPVIGTKLVEQVTAQDVLKVLRQIWVSKTVTASRLRSRMEAVFAWAIFHGHMADNNPARWVGGLKVPLLAPGKVATASNHPAVAFKDLPAWWKHLGQMEGMAAQALRFACLTGARSGEVRGATWEEIDLKAAIWTVPASRMKAGKEHRVPLNTEAISILEAMPRLEGSPYVFFAVRGGMMSDMSLSAVMRRMQAAEVKEGRPGYLDQSSKRPAVPHGCRSSFRDWVSEHTNYPGEMAEIALAHKVANAVEAAYRRGSQLEKRRLMMADWGRTLRGEALEQGAQIIQLHG